MTAAAPPVPPFSADLPTFAPETVGSSAGGAWGSAASDPSGGLPGDPPVDVYGSHPAFANGGSISADEIDTYFSPEAPPDRCPDSPALDLLRVNLTNATALVNEAEVDQLLTTIPPSSFLGKYLAWTRITTDAPLYYQLAMGAQVLGISAPLGVAVDYAGGTHPASIWTLFAGEHGDTRKSTVVNRGQDVLELLVPELMGAQPGSEAALVDMLAQTPRMAIFYPELGSLLTGSQQGHKAEIKARMTEAWDGRTIRRRFADNRETGETKEVIATEPKLALVGGASFGFLESEMKLGDFTSGFSSRWSWVAAARERFCMYPQGHAAHLPALTEHLRAISELVVGPIGGTGNVALGFTPEAAMVWEWWCITMKARWSARMNRVVLGNASRAPTLAMKYALAFACDWGEAGKVPNWRITYDVILAAILLTEWSLRSMAWVTTFLCTSDYQRARRDVLAALEFGPKSKGQLSASVRIHPRLLIDVIAALVEEGAIACPPANVVGDAGKYRRTDKRYKTEGKKRGRMKTPDLEVAPHTEAVSADLAFGGIVGVTVSPDAEDALPRTEDAAPF